MKSPRSFPAQNPFPSPEAYRARILNPSQLPGAFARAVYISPVIALRLSERFNRSESLFRAVQ